MSPESVSHTMHACYVIIIVSLSHACSGAVKAGLTERQWRLQHQYCWEEPMPAEPKDLPKFAPSHELDMKKLRQEAKGRPAGGHPGGHAAKKARVEPQPQAQRGQYDARCHPFSS